MISDHYMIAQTHSPEYLLHKYWARKPHNILANYIETYFKAGDYLCDPFCGSGVFLAECKKQNIDVIGFDLNPIAWLISEVTTNPPSTELAVNEIERIIQSVHANWGASYVIGGSEIRYLVHATEIKCDMCNSSLTRNNVEKHGNKYICKVCNNRVFLGFNNSASTKIISIVTTKGTRFELSEENALIFDRQQQESKREKSEQSRQYNIDLIPNRRILAYPGMKVSNMFTPRAFTVAAELFDLAHQIPDEKVKNCLLLFLSSNLAQFSRLIPYRNHLSTGGPAWTVPGFWIAPIHLESNPFVHMRARLAKFTSGINALHKAYKNSTSMVTVRNIAMQDELSTERHCFDGVFFDPPYGDNVPYLEFSIIWNAFLKRRPDYSSEVVVSNRQDMNSGWDKYGKDVSRAISLIRDNLKLGGKVIMTFNNLDAKAWKPTLKAFKEHNFKCIAANYQIPAVISSKAQFASSTSYVGDFYVVFQAITENIGTGNGDGNLLVERILPVILSRGGRAPKNLLIRTAILAILQLNLSIDLFDSIEGLIDQLATSEGDEYELRPSYNNKTPMGNINDIVCELSETYLASGKKLVSEFYTHVLVETSHIGSPSMPELKSILNNKVTFDKKYCYLRPLQKKLALD